MQFDLGFAGTRNMKIAWGEYVQVNTLEDLKELSEFFDEDLIITFYCREIDGSVGGITIYDDYVE